MKGVDQRSVTVGTAPVTLCAENPARVAVVVGAPLGAQGAWVNLAWNSDPSATQGMPLFFGVRRVVMHQSDYG